MEQHTIFGIHRQENNDEKAARLWATRDHGGHLEETEGNRKWASTFIPEMCMFSRQEVTLIAATWTGATITTFAIQELKEHKLEIVDVTDRMGG